MTIAPDILLARFDRLARSPAAPILLIILCLAVYLPGLAAIPPVDRDESRFAQASRQMLESVALPAADRDPALHGGGLAIPKVADRPRLAKPPLIYWLQSASAALFTAGDPLRDHIWMYRLPSALAAIAAVLLTFRLGVSIFDHSAALLAAALLAVCPMVVWDAHQARADQLLLAATTSAVFALWSIHQHPRASWPRAAWLWLSIAAGVLTKGPVTPAVLFLTALAFSAVARDWKWLARTRPLPGLAVTAALLAPWLILAASRVGLPTLLDTIAAETLGRSTTASEGHWAPPGYHTVLLAVLFWPGSLLTAAAFVRTFRLAVRIPPPESPGLAARLRTLPTRFRARVLGRTPELFLVAWILPSWILFELIATKLPHYTLPMYPAIALISAKAVLDAAHARVDTDTADRIGLGLNIWLAIGLAITAAAPIALALAGGGLPAIAAAALLAAAAAFLLITARNLAAEGLLLHAQLRALAAAVLFAVLTLGLILPRASLVWVWPRAAAAIPPGRPAAAAGHIEDSAVYLTRARIQRIPPDDALRWLRANPAGVVILERKDSTGQLDLNRLGTFAGFNYAKGRFVTLDLVERAR